MKFNPLFLAAAGTALAVLVAPLCLGAAPARTAAAPVFYSTVQQEAAKAQVTRALKDAGAADIDKASAKQWKTAVAAVVNANRNKRSFLGAMAYAVIKDHPELTMPVARMLMVDLTYPDDCPRVEDVDEIVRAIIAANPDAAPELTRDLIGQWPCRAAVITRSAISAAPAGSTGAVAAAAIAAAPLGARIDVANAARPAGGTDANTPINGALLMPVNNNPSASTSAGTLNPANITGAGSGPQTAPVEVNSPENTNGG